MLGIEENDAVSAAFFGEVEGIVHALVEARLGLFRRGGGAADAGGEEGAVGKLDTPEGLLQAARYDECAGGCGAGKEDDEFVPAPAAGKVGRTDHVFQDTCDFADHLIPFGVTEGIIDMLEGIEVDHERGEGELTRTGIFMAAAEHFFDRATIEEAGEAVVAGSEGKLFLRLCEFFRGFRDEGRKPLDRRERFTKDDGGMRFPRRSHEGRLAFAEADGDESHIGRLCFSIDADELAIHVPAGRDTEVAVGRQDLIDILLQVVTPRDTGDEEHSFGGKALDTAKCFAAGEDDLIGVAVSHLHLIADVAENICLKRTVASMLERENGELDLMPASDEREEQLAFPEIRAVKIFLIKISRGLVIEGADDERAVYRCDGHGASEGLPAHDARCHDLYVTGKGDKKDTAGKDGILGKDIDAIFIPIGMGIPAAYGDVLSQLVERGQKGLEVVAALCHQQKERREVFLPLAEASCFFPELAHGLLGKVIDGGVDVTLFKELNGDDSLTEAHAAMIDAAGGRHAGDLCLGKGITKEPDHLADRFRLISVCIYGDQNRLLPRDIGGCKKTDAVFYVTERAETIGLLDHESSNLSKRTSAHSL